MRHAENNIVIDRRFLCNNSVRWHIQQLEKKKLRLGHILEEFPPPPSTTSSEIGLFLAWASYSSLEIRPISLGRRNGLNG